MKNFFKGIIVGIGGIAPGLSGSVLLVIFGLYEKTIEAVSTVFKNFKKSVLFLFPLVCGFGIGVIIFGKVVNFFLESYPMQTAFAFLGLVLGTIPLFWREVRKEGFKPVYYFVIAISAVLGFVMFTLNPASFPQISNPTLFQSVLLGVAVAGSAIVPGVDSAVILSTLGLYKLYVNSIDNLDFSILLPAAVGLAIGALVISFVVNFFIKRFYTATFSVIFGLFISIIPNVVEGNLNIGLNSKTVVSFILLIVGFLVSFYLGDIEKNNARIKKIFNKA